MIEVLEKEFETLLNDGGNDFIRIKKEIPVRSFHGNKWKSNKTNKKYLAQDFSHRCCYCDDLDKLNGGYEAYAVEHFAPKTLFQELEFNYDNLLYCCRQCNSSKSCNWIGKSADEAVIGDKGFIDPCNDEYYKHLSRKVNGEIISLTKLGDYMYKTLKLYSKKHQVCYQMERMYIIKTKIDEILKSDLCYNDKQKLIQIKGEITDKFTEYTML